MVNRRAGFTLVELLVIVGVLAISIPSVLLLTSHTRTIRNEARLRSSATLRAEAKMEELLSQQAADLLVGHALPAALQAAKQNWQPLADTIYEWQWEAEEQTLDDEVSEDPIEVCRVLVTVRWAYNGRDQLVRTESFARTLGG